MVRGRLLLNTMIILLAKLGGGVDYNLSLQPWIQIVPIVLGFLVGLILLSIPIYLIYLIISRPLKRVEVSHQLLDIIEIAEKKGIAPEQAISGIYHRGDHWMGKKFDSMAFLVDEGMDLFSSLDTAPGLVPREVVSTLAIGRKTGNIKGLIPVCRDLLARQLSRTRGILNYVILPSLFYVFILGAFSIFIVPKFSRIYEEMLYGEPLPAVTEFLFNSIPFFALIGIVQFFGMLIFIFLFAFGPGVTRTFQLEYIMSYIFYYTTPWRRKRVKQNFAVSLATLLDAGIPEQEALILAAESTGNSVMMRLAEKGVVMMSQGVTLTEVLTALFDSKGELAWRFANSYTAIGNRPRFVQAVTGWGNWLNARAFRQEQLVAHLLSTMIIILSGIMVGIIAIAMFMPLIMIVKNMAMW